MATILSTFGSGGAGMHPGAASGTPNLATILRDIADDLETLRAWTGTLATKLNADAGVTDTNYAGIASGTIKTKKG